MRLISAVTLDGFGVPEWLETLAPCGGLTGAAAQPDKMTASKNANGLVFIESPSRQVEDEVHVRVRMARLRPRFRPKR